MTGDLVSDVPPGAVAAAHKRHDAVVTTMLCSAPVGGPAESGSSAGKDKIKKPRRYNIIGLDPTKQFLLHIATGWYLELSLMLFEILYLLCVILELLAGAEVEKDIRIQKSILRAVGQVMKGHLPLSACYFNQHLPAVDN